MHNSSYISFTGEQWQQFRADTPLTLGEDDLARLRGYNENVSLQEVQNIYLPLSRLLNLYVKATQALYGATSEFLGHKEPKTPYVIGLAGSVAVGKSTTARILRELLACWPSHSKVDLVTTDGYLYPNAVLEQQGIMERKGFPESFNQRRLIQFLSDVKAGKPNLQVPIYSHLSYDIEADKYQIVNQPDVLIVEGLNILQVGTAAKSANFVSDYFDFTIYVDAEVEIIEQWFLERFQLFRKTAFLNPRSHFHRFASMSDEQAIAFAKNVWREINYKNLMENILPSKQRAHLILEKDINHAVTHVLLKK